MEMPQTPKEFCILPNSVPMHVDHLDMSCMTLRVILLGVALVTKFFDSKLVLDVKI
jgi:hypothetical protein